MSKAQQIQLLCDLIGPNVARVIDLRDGWPGIIEVQLSTGPRQFSAHVGEIHSMSRKPHEFRFQNPGQNRPMFTLPGTEPLLLGIWDTDTPIVLVAAQPDIRLGDLTRFSILFPERLFREAQQFGWASPYRNNNGNLHWSFFPQLLPTFIEFYESSIALPTKDVQLAVVGAGLVDTPEEGSASRARRAATILIRDARFGQQVIQAYDKKCAMCGLNLGLVSGAHILPVSAPGSTDDPTNGVALCDNHHRAFDNHRIWVHPVDRTLSIHPNIINHGKSDSRTAAFLDTMLPRLADPIVQSALPPQRMFDERYAYFEGEYDWMA
jgi:hypothetical protein